MDREELEEQVLTMLEEICDDEAVREERDIDLFEAGLLDSMAAIEVLVAIEERFGVDIAPTAVERDEMNTVNKIIHQIEIRL
ncbi:D-alanine--poly(phosphoribitol) ligase subunit DltC [Collinsella vaginalis]|uniref:D-alanine--poly(phosphoribitol) ligase subunit DltC n=1 Tax=Collinsella vaginalis TaxID=1870987 RepID=UPI000A26AB58|nr:D-alanine--poly(phosphoribitol) ligase subunit DltC [Collinsella vaginalis]